VRYSDILNRISKKHGAKPSAGKPLSEEEVQKDDLSGKVNLPPPANAPPPGPLQEPTQEISRGIMSRLFKNALDAPESPARGGPTFPPLPLAEATDARPKEAEVPLSAPPPGEVRGFRNRTELLKFASLLITDIEDALNEG